MLSLDPRAEFVDKLWYPSIGVPSLLRDLKYKMSYLSKNLAKKAFNQSPNPSVGYPVSHQI